jgi:ribonuclease R
MKKKVISFFKKNAGRGFKAKEIAKKLGIFDEHEYHSLKAMLHSLEEELFLLRKGKRYQLNNIPDDNKIIGTLEINQGGYGFVIPDDKKLGDIFIAARNLGTSFSGDKVEVSLFILFH